MKAFAASFFWVCVASAPVWAQQGDVPQRYGDAATQVELAVARHQNVTGKMRGKVTNTRFDPRVREDQGWGEERRNATALAALVQARLGRFEDVVQCLWEERQAVRACTMTGDRLFLAMGAPEINGDSATITSFAWQNTSRGVAYAEIRWTLVKEREGWKVVGAFNKVVH